MSEQAIYFEDYAIGHVRTTTGRTITETDLWCMRAIPGISSRTIWMPNLPRPRRSASGLRMAR